MFAFIRRALDVERLTKELATAEAEVRELRRRVALVDVPRFREVAKGFDATQYHDHLLDQLLRDFQPLLERDAMAFLKSGVNSLKRRGARMEGAVAYDAETHQYQFEFTITARAAVVHVYAR